MPWILSGVAIVIVVGLLWWLSKADNYYLTIGLGLIIGGALGNLIDRIHYGAVVDFLDFYIMNYHWPTFNLADCAVTIGVGIVLLESWLQHREET